MVTFSPWLFSSAFVYGNASPNMNMKDLFYKLSESSMSMYHHFFSSTKCKTIKGALGVFALEFNIWCCQDYHKCLTKDASGHARWH